MGVDSLSATSLAEFWLGDGADSVSVTVGSSNNNTGLIMFGNGNDTVTISGNGDQQCVFALGAGKNLIKRINNSGADVPDLTLNLGEGSNTIQSQFNSHWSFDYSRAHEGFSIDLAARRSKSASGLLDTWDSKVLVDLVNGTDYADTLVGSADNDFFNVGFSDFASLGLGNDNVALFGANATVDGGSGVDKLSVSDLLPTDSSGDGKFVATSVTIDASDPKMVLLHGPMGRRHTKVHSKVSRRLHQVLIIRQLPGPMPMKNLFSRVQVTMKCMTAILL